MKKLSHWLTSLLVIAAVSLGSTAQAQQEPKQGSWTTHDFSFHDGTMLKDLTLAYTTLGDPKNEAIVVLHGTTGTGTGMMGANFGGQLFGPGQPFDASKYFIVLPDSIGTGRSSKPSNGLRSKFPQYNYHDMVKAYHLLLTQGLGLKHVRLIIGNSMGGMHVWMFGELYPDYADILVPMASMPIAMSGRNWMTRRLIIDSIRNDPAYEGGFYTTQPKSAQVASVMYAVATNGGANALQKNASTRQAADELLNKRLAAPFKADANDILFQWQASRDFDPEPKLETIKAQVVMINSADDERNPPELQQAKAAMKRVARLKYVLIPGSEATAGHGTTGQAKWWGEEVRAVLGSTPRLQAATSLPVSERVSFAR
jgi:homoserine O-acetyltransferase